MVWRLFCEGLLFTLAAWALQYDSRLGITFAAIACGMQNGMASCHLRLTLRTTHVTGIITDLGMLLGLWLRHRRIEGWKIATLLVLLAGFVGGCAGGVWAYQATGLASLWGLATFVFLAGLTHLIWRLWWLHQGL